MRVQNVQKDVYRCPTFTNFLGNHPRTPHFLIFRTPNTPKGLTPSQRTTPKSVHGALIYILLRMHFLTQLMFRGFIPHSTGD